MTDPIQTKVHLADGRWEIPLSADDATHAVIPLAKLDELGCRPPASEKFRQVIERALSGICGDISKAVSEDCGCGEDHLLLPTAWAIVFEAQDVSGAEDAHPSGLPNVVFQGSVSHCSGLLSTALAAVGSMGAASCYVIEPDGFD